MKKDRLHVSFDAALSAELDALAARRKIPKSRIVEAALAAFLSPDGADQREAAIVRRLDRLTRAVEQLERDVTVGNEALALFVKFWLTTTPPLPRPSATRRRPRALKVMRDSSRRWGGGWRRVGRWRGKCLRNESIETPMTASDTLRCRIRPVSSSNDPFDPTQ